MENNDKVPLLEELFFWKVLTERRSGVIIKGLLHKGQTKENACTHQSSKKL
jgi:hypothetical protein